MMRKEGKGKGGGGGPGEGRFGMLDAAYYFNSKSFKVMNCDSHSDPGLLVVVVVAVVVR